MANSFLRNLRGRLIALLLLAFVPAAVLVVALHLHPRDVPGSSLLAENLAVLLMAVLPAAAAAWIAVDGLVLRRVRRLAAFSRQLAQGEFSARNGAGRGTLEFDQLAQALDQVAESLEQRENERLRAERALHASEERFRAVAESSIVGIFRADAAGRCLYVNPQWCRITGLDAALACGEGWLDQVHPVDRPRVSLRWEQAASRRERFRDEFRFLRADGKEVWVLGDALPEDAGTGSLVGTFTDISERVQTETRLRTTEERLRVFMGNNPAACWIIGEDGRYVYLNKALAEMLDGSEATLTGQSIFDLYPPDLARQYDEANRQVLRDGRVLETVERAPRRDGSMGDFATLRYALRDSDGRDVVGGLSIDVTERSRMAQALKSSEERFREFMDNNPALCWISDEGGRITYVNETFVQMLRLSLDPVGRHPIELFPTAVARRHQYGVRAALERPTSTETQERFPRRDGSEGDFTVFRFPLAGAEGRRSVGGVAIDVTEQRRAADELREANVRLQSLSNRIIEVQETERRQLARELHDEIGQCLTALKISLEGLQRTATEAAVVRRIQDSVELSAHTLEQVRRLSVDLRPSQLDDLGLEPALRSMLDRQAGTGNFTPHFDAAFDGGKLSDQVETACFRVCQEALTNIIKHAGARNVWMHIEQRAGRLHLQVRDDGRGFDPGQGRARASAGESFGLLGMQERAMLAGGELEIHSTPGQGTEVQAWFSLTDNSTGGRQ
ncbi:MAG TPA: PAS domain S-box protein [Burkholderiales bacterium]|nr:PAS domain S-box protein [Burkholderiales bacterium]